MRLFRLPRAEPAARSRRLGWSEAPLRLPKGRNEPGPTALGTFAVTPLNRGHLSVIAAMILTNSEIGARIFLSGGIMACCATRRRRECFGHNPRRESRLREIFLFESAVTY
jgi:hypothetical protein